MAERTAVPIYFVLGNHDDYRGSIGEVRRVAGELTRDCELLNWLPVAGAVSLSENVSLVGHGGWGDGRIGSFLDSDVVLNDSLLIQELRDANAVEGTLNRSGISNRTVLTPGLLDLLHALGDKAAEHFRTAAESVIRGV